MSHANRLKIQIPATRGAPVSAQAIGRLAASIFRLLDAGATGAVTLIGALRPHTVRVELADAIEQLSEDRPLVAVILKRTLKKVGNY